MNHPQRQYCDIGYSFLIGGDGNVYEGRGWDRLGAHTEGFNSVVRDMDDMWSHSGALTQW
jgi:hypothetical protein